MVKKETLKQQYNQMNDVEALKKKHNVYVTADHSIATVIVNAPTTTA